MSIENIEIVKLEKGSADVEKTAAFAVSCSWGAGKSFAAKLRAYEFEDFETAFAAKVNGQIAGYCTLTRTDYIPDCELSPWIGFVFVGEEFRGHRISQRMIEAALDCSRKVGFDKAYISTEEIGLYEKYGFKPLTKLKSYSGSEERILVYNLD